MSTMEIREASEKDLQQIISVLKKSLGEKELPISPEVWRYKHEDNPFGESLVLLAEVKGKIVGVRAFMRWKWGRREESFSALRAVDTATHPEFQGKGIFKRLTLAAVDQAKMNGGHFIFNTPNEKSRPGYLKMGWSPSGKVRVGIFPVVASLFRRTSDNVYNNQIKASEVHLESLCTNWNKKLANRSGFYTPKSSNFLKWRYENNPLQNYEVYSDRGLYYAIYIKARGRLKELRISELIYDNDDGLKQSFKLIKRRAAELGANFISFSPQLTSMKFSFQGNIGPILTVRNLNCDQEEINKLLQLHSWEYSLGDLELF